ncbi:MAG: hypothetical protein L3K07_02425 [Thermoplasmata archaeon]|nr:hypothetical protein [Thermoplasmata archaeon]
MVFLVDKGGVFDAPVEEVWGYLASGEEHSQAHHHEAVRRVRHSPSSLTYSWEQRFDGEPTRFAMRSTAYAPVGIAYEVLEGPFTGSSFFLYYTPKGDRTSVTVAGEFLSPTIPPSHLAAAVERFFALEFEQDGAAIRSRRHRSA